MTFAYLYGECQQELADAKLTIENLRQENFLLKKKALEEEQHYSELLRETDALKKKLAELEGPAVREECPEVGKYTWVDCMGSGWGDNPTFDTVEEATAAATEYMLDIGQDDCHIVKLVRHRHNYADAAFAAVESLIDDICDGTIENDEAVAKDIEDCDDLEDEIATAIEKIVVRKGLDKIVLCQEEFAMDAPGGEQE